jgi:YcaO-like protein with predicted kinase domain
MAEHGKRWRTGTHRAVSAETTVDRLRPRLAEFGVTRVANITGLDRVGLPVVTVARPGSRSFAVAQGKGLDLALAAASGLMESVETWYAERSRLPLRKASRRELRCEANPVGLTGLPRQRGVPVPEDQALSWIAGKGLLRAGAQVWVPHALIHTDFRFPPRWDPGWFCSGTNGLASGNCRVEALLHATCEVIERDALTLWHQRSGTSQAMTRVAIDTIDDPDCRAVLDRYGTAGMRVGIWDATSDVGVATFHVEILESGAKSPILFARPVAGDGCHPSRSIALLRALLEAAQSRLTYIVGTREDISDADLAPSASRVRSAAARLTTPLPAGRRFGDIPDHDGATLETDLEHVLQRLRDAGAMEIAAVDLADEGHDGLAVARVVVPGLETAIAHPHHRPGPRALRVQVGASVLPCAEAML